MSIVGRLDGQLQSAYAPAREHRIPAIAAGLAYYEFNSLIPLR